MRSSLLILYKLGSAPQPEKCFATRVCDLLLIEVLLRESFRKITLVEQKYWPRQNDVRTIYLESPSMTCTMGYRETFSYKTFSEDLNFMDIW